MAPRAPGVHTHEEWKGMAQPVGLVVEPVVLNRLGVFPESAITVLADWQQRLEQLLEDQPVGEQWLSVAPSFELFCQEVLAWQPGDLRKPEEFAAPVAVHLDDYDEVLRPDWIVPEPSQGDGPLKAQLLVQELPLGTPFDALPKGADGRRSWEATPQQRLERLLKESEHPIGLLWNGVALRLVYAPRGESSGHLTFPLEPMTTVDGRPMLAALQMLLGPDRLFEGGASNTRLRPLMEQSRKEQNEVSTRLAEQVLEALWILLRGFDAAGLEVEDPSHIYGGLITVLLRLVFLLYAEDEELMPTDSLYGQHYSVGGLAQRLRQDRADYQNAMEGRRGAWATLLSLFRLVYDGGGSTEAYLPARHGDLFDPETYPFLEGRTADTSYRDGPLASVPAISDDVVEQVLTKLLLLDGQILSYRALDVEQIGSVYEGIMGFMVEKATGPSVGITHRPLRQKITITVVVDACELLAQPASKREKWLKDATGVDLKLGDKVNKGIKTATTVEDLCDALDRRLSKHTPRGGFQASSLILQPTAERRRSGSHYTPRSLTEPIVTEALRPWLERCKGQPSADQILALKVCDPAMGSGAFLVALCRYLAFWLVQAWERDGYPPEFSKYCDKDIYARRLIAQQCLYGVDKNLFAVGLAKMSLWLVTLSKDLPFTFVDHALKNGDSLVGCTSERMDKAFSMSQLSFFRENSNTLAKARMATCRLDTRSDRDYLRKTELNNQITEKNKLQLFARDAITYAYFSSSSEAEAESKVNDMVSEYAIDPGSMQHYSRVLRSRLSPFHWEIEFPEIFCEGRDGFDLVIGNPPFLGGSRLMAAYGARYPEYLRDKFPKSNGKGVDLCAFFFRQAALLISQSGSFSLIATKRISQGDTRQAGLAFILDRECSIYSAVKTKNWPGAAAVVISELHICRNSCLEAINKLFLNGKKVNAINSRLRPFPEKSKPYKLYENRTSCFAGCKIYGEGFIFAKSQNDIRPEYAGGPEELKSLLEKNPRCSEIVSEYIGGKEISGHPLHSGHRIIINFGDLSLAEIQKNYPEALLIVEQKVKPARDALSGDYKLNERRKKYWWKYAGQATNLTSALSGKQYAIAMPRTTTYIAVGILDAQTTFSEKAIVFPAENIWAEFAFLSSRFHEIWSLEFCLSQGSGDSPVYKPEECRHTLPTPECLLPDYRDTGSKALLDEIARLGRAYHDARASYMRGHSIGLTSHYNQFHSPNCVDDHLAEIRALRGAIDAKIAEAYAFGDVAFECGFYLQDFETLLVNLDDEAQWDEHGEIFSILSGSGTFSREEALGYDSQIREALGISGNLPWRFGWCDSLRDCIFSRLLSLNAERYEREVALCMHGKGANKVPRSNSRNKRKISQLSDFALSSEPYQTGLQLF